LNHFSAVISISILFFLTVQLSLLPNLFLFLSAPKANPIKKKAAALKDFLF